MDNEFRNAYKQLNRAQRQAVDAIDGPVLVVAGPGTGKTQLLSLRVANILNKTDTDPASILCLTFTNFAATNMQQRLGGLIGPAAQAIVIRTFHSFAAELMNLYPEYFWQGAKLQIAPDPVQLEIIQTILGQLPLSNPLATKFAGVYTATNDVKQSIKLAKEAGLTPSKLKAMLDASQSYIEAIEPDLIKALEPRLSQKRLAELQTAIDALPDQAIDATIMPLISLSTVIRDGLNTAVEADAATGKLTQTGKWKRRWLQTVEGKTGMFDERRRLAWWQALASAYETYQIKLHELGYYDYADMILEVITQLEQQPELLASVQERFLYVLIDEFQDTNAAQLRLAHLVASHPSTENRPNLMAVGDDDQAIFAFNGAELSNMLAFRHNYQATKTIMLTENYRSSQQVLKLAEQVIAQAETRLINNDSSLSKQLKAQPEAPQSKEDDILHLSFPTIQHQMAQVADRIADIWGQSNQQSLAVLARSHRSLRNISALLNERGVPIRYEQQNNVFELPLVNQVIMLAQTVLAINQGDKQAVNYHLSRLLAHPAWQVEPQQLWQLALSNSKGGSWLDSLASHESKPLATIAVWLMWLGQQASHQPLPVMLEYFIGLRAGEVMTSPLHNYFVSYQAASNDYLSGLSGLNKLRSAVSEFSAANGQTRSQLSDLSRLLDLYHQLDMPLTDESWFASGERAVQLLTVYKAKGLEFDTVFVLDTTDDNWRPKHQSRRPPANLPLQPYGEVFDDYVRLMYVATTRAKQKLILSSYRFDETGKTIMVSPLIGAFKSQIIEPDDTDKAQSISILEQNLQWPRLETQHSKALLATRIRDFKLSATGLLDFLDVSQGGPQHFLERHVLRLPELTTANMAFGTAVHTALQIAAGLVNQHKFDLESVIDAYQTALTHQVLTPIDFERYTLHGKQVLQSLFESKGFAIKPGGQAELKLTFSSPQLGNLTGNLDHIISHDNEILITDYKTGKPLSSFATRDRTKAIKAWRHRTQLEFYTLLAQKSNYQPSPQTKNIRAQIVYVEAEQPQQVCLQLMPDKTDLTRLEKLISVVWQHITNLELPDTSSYAPDANGITKFITDLLEK